MVLYLAYSGLLCYNISAMNADNTRCIVPCPGTGPTATFCNLAVTQNVCVSGNTQLNGNLTVCGSFTGPTVTTANFVYSYDTTPSQAVDTPNTFQDITFSTDALINGWLHTPGLAPFTCEQTGLYLVQYHAILKQTNENDVITTVRAVLGGDDNEIAGSAFTVNLPITGDEVEISNSFLISASLGQVLSFQFTGSTANVELVADQNAASNVIPCITITIVRIA